MSENRVDASLEDFPIDIISPSPSIETDPPKRKFPNVFDSKVDVISTVSPGKDTH